MDQIMQIIVRLGSPGYNYVFNQCVSRVLFCITLFSTMRTLKSSHSALLQILYLTGKKPQQKTNNNKPITKQNKQQQNVPVLFIHWYVDIRANLSLKEIKKICLKES